jgi:hypothetical protein
MMKKNSNLQHTARMSLNTTIEAHKDTLSGVTSHISNGKNQKEHPDFNK